MRAHLPWRAEDDAYLRANWETMRTADIANHLGRTGNAVIGRAGRLKLPRISPKVSAQRGGATRARQLAGETVVVTNPRARKTVRDEPVAVAMAERCRFCGERYVHLNAHVAREHQSELAAAAILNNARNAEAARHGVKWGRPK